MITNLSSEELCFMKEGHDLVADQSTAMQRDTVARLRDSQEFMAERGNGANHHAAAHHTVRRTGLDGKLGWEEGDWVKGVVRHCSGAMKLGVRAGSGDVTEQSGGFWVFEEEGEA